MQDRNIKGDHFHLEGIGAPQLLLEFINLYRWYFLNFSGFKFKMSLPSQSSPSRNYTRPFSGFVLLSLFVARLQNSRLNRVECTLSTIPTCVHLPGGVSFLSVYLRIYRLYCRDISRLLLIFTFSLRFLVLFSLQAIFFVICCLVVFFHILLQLFALARKSIVFVSQWINCRTRQLFGKCCD